MLSRIRTLRRHLATELGFIVPPVHISDNLRLKPREYVISLRGVEIGRWQTEGNQLLAVSADPQARALPGKETREPAFGVQARWIAPALEEQALAAGLLRCRSDQRDHHASVGAGPAARPGAAEPRGDQAPDRYAERLPSQAGRGADPQGDDAGRGAARSAAAAARAGIDSRPGHHSGGAGRGRAREQALPHLVELCRQAMGRRLVQPHLDADGALPVLLLDPAIDEELQSCFGDGGSGVGETRRADRPVIRRMADSLKKLTGGANATAWPVLLCQSPARYHIRRWLEPAVPRVTVLAPSEVPADVRVRSLGTVR